MNFCRRCGSQLTHIEKHIYTCPNGHTVFANASPTVGVFFITPEGRVLLSVRGIEPHKGMLDSFGGFLDDSETFEEAAERELHEELSLESKDFEDLKYLTSSGGNYPYKEEMLPIVSVFFWTRLKTDRQLIPSDDVAAIKSLPLHEVDMALLHDDDIRQGLQALQRIFPL